MNLENLHPVFWIHSLSMQCVLQVPTITTSLI